MQGHLGVNLLEVFLVSSKYLSNNFLLLIISYEKYLKRTSSEFKLLAKQFCVIRIDRGSSGREWNYEEF